MGKMFMVKGEKMYVAKLPLKEGDAQEKFKLPKAPIILVPSNSDKKDQMVAFSTADDVIIFNTANSKQAEIAIKDVTTIEWAEENDFLFIGDKTGKVAQFRVDI
jgi:hypothetical protein